MKSLKKLTISITTLACVLSLAACNDAKEEEIGFKDKGKEVEYTEYVEKLNTYSENFTNNNSDYVFKEENYETYLFDSDAQHLEGEAETLITREYDSDENIFIECESLEKSEILNGSNVNYLYDYLSVSQEYNGLFVDADSRTMSYTNSLYDNAYGAALESINNIFYVLQSNFIEEDYKFSYYVNNNVFTLVRAYIGEDTSNASVQTMQIQFKTNSFDIYMESNEETKEYTYTIKSINHFEFKEVDLEPVDLSEYTILQ